jgi:hypothetical protein
MYQRFAETYRDFFPEDEYIIFHRNTGTHLQDKKVL